MCGLSAFEDRFRQIGSQEGEWDDAADIAFIEPCFFCDGSLVDGLASQNAIDPVVRSRDRANQRGNFVRFRSRRIGRQDQAHISATSFQLGRSFNHDYFVRIVGQEFRIVGYAQHSLAKS